ncbi:MAG: D-alanine--D-alanine ligase family protein [Candidatus Methylomirabilales bacterium]
MAKRLRVGVIFGGRSGEHEVSLASAASVVTAMDRARYEPVLLYITKGGTWHQVEAVPAAPLQPGGGRLAFPPDPGPPVFATVTTGGVLRTLPLALDVAFPVLHGTYGEDGTVQGLLELLDLPYVGPGVLASALGMDKALMKGAFRQAGLPVVEYEVLPARRWEGSPDACLEALIHRFPFPCFVKPANLGSSVGVSKAVDRPSLAAALALAARYDRKLIVERGLDAREIEVSVLGNEIPEASVPGEILSAREWYDYQAKYTPGAAEAKIPALLPPRLAEAFRALALQAYAAIDCAGMARVDFFLERETDQIYVNEINTIPGFTATSVYPKLWEASGLAYPALLDRLIGLALDRHRDRGRRTTSYEPGR